ncbi:hypothetical protein ElyMa_004318800 [Elysia marginata]|uniref:Prokineticin domain-containing protein n=1 Tax=Elysia marginata TaxID=1093978 RepID=A0AAV4GZ99_9GAST|nr:hypothetical protein ElyMa_004318800 [Elysia marginata]
MLRLTLVVLLVCVLTDQAWGGLIVCNKLNEPCLPLPLSCCRGMVCKRDKLVGGLRCQQGHGLLGRCYRRGELCTPELGNNPCCRGLHCIPRMLNPTVHECERI